MSGQRIPIFWMNAIDASDVYASLASREAFSMLGQDDSARPRSFLWSYADRMERREGRRMAELRILAMQRVCGLVAHFSKTALSLHGVDDSRAADVAADLIDFMCRRVESAPIDHVARLL